jgi:LysR family hydrogen peroxide-inducible transcriptional activator
MNFTLRQLTYFKALAAQRNFGRAAAVCNVSQPALSVQIRSLEDTMGGALVERRSRDVVLTRLGREVLSRAEAVLGAAARLDAVARDRSGRVLSLGLIPTLAPYLLPGVLAALRARDLEQQVEIREAKTAILLDALDRGDIDAAVIALPSGAADLVERPLFEDRFLLAGSVARLSALGPSAEDLRPSDLRASQLMLLEDGHCLTDQALEACGRTPQGGGINMGASSLGTLARLVQAGFGYTLMPEIAAEAECAGLPDIELRRFRTPEPARTIGLVRRASTGAVGWFDDLAGVLEETAHGILTPLRAAETTQA